MRPAGAFAILALASLVTLPRASVAHAHGQPAEFPLWRGTPEMTVYAPVPPRLDAAPRVRPVAAQPAPVERQVAPRPC